MARVRLEIGKGTEHAATVIAVQNVIVLFQSTGTRKDFSIIRLDAVWLVHQEEPTNEEKLLRWETMYHGHDLDGQLRTLLPVKAVRYYENTKDQQKGQYGLAYKSDGP